LIDDDHLATGSLNLHLFIPINDKRFTTILAAFASIDQLFSQFKEDTLIGHSNEGVHQMSVADGRFSQPDCVLIRNRWAGELDFVRQNRLAVMTICPTLGMN
jgi:hypothetical protein